MNDLNRPLLGEPNAPCRTCGTPLAADQRYCLQCGTRRAEARLPFLDILAQQVGQDPARTTTTTTTASGPDRGFLGRMSTNAVAVAGVACLVLALGVGVLIGGLGHNDNATAAPPQVITVGGVAAAAPAASTAAPAPTSAVPGATGAAAGAAVARRAARRHRAASSSSSTSRATNNAVKRLNDTSGGDYAKRSARLPRQLGTGGRAPPKDTSGRAIGGGSDVQSIG